MHEHDGEHELDTVAETRPLAWLIQAAAGTMVGVMPWSLSLSLPSILDPSPAPPWEILLEQWVIPMSGGAVVAGIVALIIIMAARSGRPMGNVAIVALSVVAALLGSLVIAGTEPGIGHVIGLVCGIFGGIAILVVRNNVLRDG